MTQTQRQLIDRPVSFEWAGQLYELRDIDGDKIGDVVEVNPDYLVAQTHGGFLGLGERRLYYVPVSAVNRDPEGHYRVSVDKDDVETMAWGQPPSESDWSASEWRSRLRGEYDEDRTDATRLIGWEEELQGTARREEFQVEDTTPSRSTGR